MQPNSDPRQTGKVYFRAAALLFPFAAAVGLLAALKIALPEPAVRWIAMETMRPLHTFLSITGVLVGLQGAVLVMAGGTLGKWGHRLNLWMLGTFLVSGILVLTGGHATGREYFSWPTSVSVPMTISLAILLFALFGARQPLQRRSPEGFWLIGFGCLFIFIGFLESHAWQSDAVSAIYVRDLSIQWHSIDTFFAGINAALYGCAVFLISDRPKPLRTPVLFGIAAFSLLFTFGHHHYASPQPQYLKSLAVVASLLALVSFLRHIRHFRELKQGCSETAYIPVLWRTIEGWTIVSIVSGVLFAVPQVNLLVHGTYLIVIHAMGSMIGINMVIIFLAGFTLVPVPHRIRAARVKAGIHMVNAALAGLWLVLGTSGMLKGIIRISGSYHEYQPLRAVSLYGFPVLGGLLSLGIMILGRELWLGYGQRAVSVSVLHDPTVSGDHSMP